MKRHSILIFTFLISISSYGQKKIILTNGLKRAKIKVGKIIGLTQKNEPYYYANWKSVCNDRLDTLCMQNTWILDSIKTEYIVLKQNIDNDTAYVFDTLTYRDNKKIRKYQKDWYFVDEIISPDSILLNNKLVFKYPRVFNYKRVPFDSIQSITFSKSDDCFGYDLGVPLIASIFVIGSPIVAFKNKKFDVETFIVGETIGLYLVYAMYIDYQKKLVKTYQTSKWKMKIR